jgi:hypothetical protein
VQETFTNVAVPITRMPLQIDLSDHRSDGISQIVPPKCGASQQSQRILCNLPRCASPLDGKKDLIDHRGEQPRLRRTEQRPTVDHHAVIAPFQLAQKVWHPFTCKCRDGIRRVGRQRQIIESQAWGGSYQLSRRPALQDMQDPAAGGSSKLARD